MGDAMPAVLRGLAVVGLVASFLGGCVAQRQPLVIVEPEYSYVRDGLAMADTLPASLELAVDLTVDENGLLQTATPDAARLVQIDAPMAD